jgi:hypothetical protein
LIAEATGVAPCLGPFAKIPQPPESLRKDFVAAPYGDDSKLTVLCQGTDFALMQKAKIMM